MIFDFDFVSPYAYLAATQIHALAARVGREVELAPVLLAGLLEAHETKGPAEVPAKRAYLAKDVQRGSARAPTKPSRAASSASRRCWSTARSSGARTPSILPRSTRDGERGTWYGPKRTWPPEPD